MPRRNFLITKKALAQYLHISRNTLAKRLKTDSVNINNMNDVLDYIVEHTPKRFVPKIVSEMLEKIIPCPICNKEYQYKVLQLHMGVQHRSVSNRSHGVKLNIPKYDD